MEGRQSLAHTPACPPPAASPGVPRRQPQRRRPGRPRAAGAALRRARRRRRGGRDQRGRGARQCAARRGGLSCLHCRVRVQAEGVSHRLGLLPLLRRQRLVRLCASRAGGSGGGGGAGVGRRVRESQAASRTGGPLDMQAPFPLFGAGKPAARQRPASPESPTALRPPPGWLTQAASWPRAARARPGPRGQGGCQRMRPAGPAPGSAPPAPRGAPRRGPGRSGGIGSGHQSGGPGSRARGALPLGSLEARSARPPAHLCPDPAAAQHAGPPGDLDGQQGAEQLGLVGVYREGLLPVVGVLLLGFGRGPRGAARVRGAVGEGLLPVGFVAEGRGVARVGGGGGAAVDGI
jgi:hypothetical protein